MRIVIADAFIWVTADALILDIDADAWTRTRAHLEKLLVADDVEFEDATDLVVVDVEGPAALDATGATSARAHGASSWWAISLVGNLPRYGGPAVSVIARRDSIDSTIAAIIAKAPGSRRVDTSILETIRIENGVARAGVDTTDKTIALEARLNRAISFNKGCYLGQETIERATARGGLKKRMFGLKFRSEGLPAAGAILTLAGKEVGRVTQRGAIAALRCYRACDFASQRMDARHGIGSEARADRQSCRTCRSRRVDELKRYFKFIIRACTARI